ncbi:MAG: hypothetical protein ACR2PM_21020 [Hyphomicrobiales bacterium]
MAAQWNDTAVGYLGMSIIVCRGYLLAIVLSALLIAQPCGQRAEAADLPGSVQYQVETESGFSATIVPFYLWMSGINGTVGALGVNVDVDITPIDILKNLGEFLDVLEGVYFGTGEVRYGRFGAFYDIVYLEVSSLNEVDLEFVRGRLDVAFDQKITTLAGSFRLYETSDGYLDLLAGARIWDINQDVGLDLGIVGLTVSEGSKWVDPLVGGKGRYNLSENFYISGWAMVGGVVTGSEFMWDVWGNVGYQVAGWLDAFVGFRAMGTDYDSGGIDWDVVQVWPDGGRGDQVLSGRA